MESSQLVKAGQKVFELVMISFSYQW